MGSKAKYGLSEHSLAPRQVLVKQLLPQLLEDLGAPRVVVSLQLVALEYSLAVGS